MDLNTETQLVLVPINHGVVGCTANRNNIDVTIAIEITDGQVFDGNLSRLQELAFPNPICGHFWIVDSHAGAVLAAFAALLLPAARENARGAPDAKGADA